MRPGTAGPAVAPRRGNGRTPRRTLARPMQIKRWITTAEAMDRFQFDWAKIKRWDVPLASLGLPDGPDISWP